jgi:hypothetical protein
MLIMPMLNHQFGGKTKAALSWTLMTATMSSFATIRTMAVIQMLLESADAELILSVAPAWWWSISPTLFVLIKVSNWRIWMLN